MSERFSKSGMIISMVFLLLVGAGAWAVLMDTDPQEDLSDVEIVDEGFDESAPRRAEKNVDERPVGGVIKGRILDSQDKPLSADISIRMDAPPGVQAKTIEPTVLQLKTNSTGEFVSAATGYCLVSMVIKPKEGAPLERRFLKLAGKDYDLGVIRIESGGTLSGLILDDDGDPVAGAVVVVGRRGRVADRDGVGQFLVGIDQETARETQTNEQGEFRLAGLTPGRVSIIARAPGFQPASESNIEMVNGESKTIDIELERSRSLTVEIRDAATNQFIPNARIRLSALGYQRGDQVLRSFNELDLARENSGSVTVKGLSDRRYRVRVFVRGYVIAKDKIVDATESKVVVALAACGEAFGRIFDASSKESISGCRISISHLSSRNLGSGFEVLGPEETARYFEQTSDVGLFGIRGGQSHSTRINFLAVGYAAGSIEVENLRSGERRRLAVGLQPEGKITGKILSHEYKPLSGATVTAELIDDQSAADDAAEAALMSGNVESVDPLNGAVQFRPRAIVESMTDKDGLFVLSGLAAGKYRLTASHPRQQAATPRDYIVAHGKTLAEVEIQLRPAGAVKGQVVGRNNQPIAAASVSIRTPTPAGASGGLASLALTEEIADTVADQQGRFLITGIKPGSYSLLVTGPSVEQDEGETDDAILLPIRIRPGVDLEKFIVTKIR